MTDEQKHAIEHAQKVLRAVKLYDLAASLAAPTILDSADDGESIRPAAIYQVKVGESWVDSNVAEYSAVTNEKRIVYATRDAAPIVDTISDAWLQALWQEVNNEACRPIVDRMPVHLTFAHRILALARNGTGEEA